MSGSILIVDDDPVQRRLLEAAVIRMGHEAVTAESGEAALQLLDGAKAGAMRLVVLDLVMPGVDGLGVLEAMRARGIDLPVIVQTAQGGIETVVRAMRGGAFDFVVKPVSPDKLKLAVTGALRVAERGSIARQSLETRPASHSFKNLVTRSPAMAGIIRLGQKAAASNIPILIEGESGVGKEVVARAIQAASSRAKRPFVTVNCGAIPENLVESTLFGHEKGSFTGAVDKRSGKFVEADTGTLFLDEVGDLPLDAQVKLLRAVQEGEIDPVGARSHVKVDIRLISATHRDLQQRVKEGSFREDLYYRLNVFPIAVPPLRERREDIPLLVEHFIAGIAAEEKRQNVAGIAPDALDMLCRYDWPGNIRQLENAIFRAVVLCDTAELTLAEFPQIRAQVDGVIEVGPASAPASAAPQPPQPGQTPAADPAPPESGALRLVDPRGNFRPMAELEGDIIRAAIVHYNGQMSEVARRLGIGRSTLYRKLKELGLDPETGRGERLAS